MGKVGETEAGVIMSNEDYKTAIEIIDKIFDEGIFSNTTSALASELSLLDISYDECMELFHLINGKSERGK
ncbi:MAG: hypothetical protein M0Q91_14465 [Methanoregula sp.]|jgi:antitoxin component HigA of HigAB toxin-antitoxin module|nr:hypothetical protein [Methanoregula sp.]